MAAADSERMKEKPLVSILLVIRDFTNPHSQSPISALKPQQSLPKAGMQIFHYGPIYK